MSVSKVSKQTITLILVLLESSLILLVSNNWFGFVLHNTHSKTTVFKTQQQLNPVGIA